MLKREIRHRIVLNKWSSKNPWLINTMDWNLGTDHSLQEMLDCDIKSEIDSVIGGHPELGLNFTDHSPLELDDDNASCNNDIHCWFGSQSYLNGNSNSSHSNFNLDLNGYDAASVMVNPNSVMPNVSSNRSTSPSISSCAVRISCGRLRGITAEQAKRHFAFSSKLGVKQKRKEEFEFSPTRCQTEEVELESDMDRDYENEGSDSEASANDESDGEELTKVRPKIKISLSSARQKPKTLHLPPSSITTLSPLFKPQQQQQHHYHYLSHHHEQHQQVKVSGLPGSLRLQNVKILSSSPSQMQTLRRQIYTRNLQMMQAQQQTATTVVVQQQLIQHTSQLAQLGALPLTSSKREKELLDPLAQDYEKAYPKPAYSYSCLIAMALKNSQTGSLPVSEIYNFMCAHFPYFKTAPNGWKNSVRHNLSLNKCFEKIEKPVGNGNQRKGCLWAISPAKIAKMDEEVQKWSRKDPLSIKKAMIYPEQLELLERGEMKYMGTSSCGDMSEDTESSGDETEGCSHEVEGTGIAGVSTVGGGHLHVVSHIVAANSVTDSYDESSQDCDVDVNEHLYDEIDIDEENKETLHMRLDISKQDSGSLSDYHLSPCSIGSGVNSKRQKMLSGTLQTNYAFQPVVTARKKAPLFLATGATTGSFLKIE